MPVYDGYHMMWGVHWGWWLICIALFAVLIYVIVSSVGRKEPRPATKTPREILERRYAAGEISTEEFRERTETLAGKHG